MEWLEVKPYSKAQHSDFFIQFKAKQAKAQEIGIPLILVTEKQIRVNPVLNGNPPIFNRS
ncbi:Tn7 transposase TnsA N-terminal domain-containing protein [Photobacterium sp. TY1-4]|nr:Tn7 transposase TnsA N-terminal domain-containing protein [Photobacterium sp. TY1-4]UXI02014.1 Tn7 transposase TnsA N-terminal domain-containing protein [Photobacterium sp. TY1-4]